MLLLPQLGFFEPDDEDIDVDEDHPDYDEKWDAAQEEIERTNHGEFVDALLDLHRELIGTSDDALPGWTEDYQLPGEVEAVAKTVRAEERLAKEQLALEEAHAALASLQRRKALVAGTGKVLEARVHEALTELGCTVEDGEPNRTDRIVRWGDKVAVIEIKGLTKSAGERDAAQLEKWVSDYTLEHDAAPKGILAVSAWRDLPLRERNDPAFPHQMLKYCTARGHCLLETSQLLAAALTCKTKKAKDSFLKAMFETAGVLDGYGWETVLTYTETDEQPEG